MDTAEENNKCFVISPIGTSGTDGHQRAKNVLKYVITPAAKAVGLEAVRADDLSQPGSIATQVIQQLISAKMVVADLTELNPNVFYELAVRDSFGLPVVLIAEEGTTLPFDVIQQRTIFFDSGDLGSAIPARDRIADALREALEDPAGGSPVKAAVDLSTLRSGNPEERQVAELAEQIGRMSQEMLSLRQEVAASDKQRMAHRGVLAAELGAISQEKLVRVLQGERGLLSAMLGDNFAEVLPLARAELMRRSGGD